MSETPPHIKGNSRVERHRSDLEGICSKGWHVHVCAHVHVPKTDTAAQPAAPWSVPFWFTFANFAGSPNTIKYTFRLRQWPIAVTGLKSLHRTEKKVCQDLMPGSKAAAFFSRSCSGRLLSHLGMCPLGKWKMSPSLAFTSLKFFETKLSTLGAPNCRMYSAEERRLKATEVTATVRWAPALYSWGQVTSQSRIRLPVSSLFPN